MREQINPILGAFNLREIVGTERIFWIFRICRIFGIIATFEEIRRDKL